MNAAETPATVEALAREQGRQAYRAGLPKQPAEDPEFIRDWRWGDDGRMLYAASAWAAGWQELSTAAFFAKQNNVTLTKP